MTRMQGKSGAMPSCSNCTPIPLSSVRAQRRRTFMAVRVSAPPKVRRNQISTTMAVVKEIEKNSRQRSRRCFTGGKNKIRRGFQSRALLIGMGKRLFFALKVSARAAITAMAGLKKEQGSHECEGEILLPVFHCTKVILIVTMLFLKYEKKTESRRAYCC